MRDCPYADRYLARINAAEEPQMPRVLWCIPAVLFLGLVGWMGLMHFKSEAENWVMNTCDAFGYNQYSLDWTLHARCEDKPIEQVFGHTKWHEPNHNWVVDADREDVGI